MFVKRLIAVGSVLVLSACAQQGGPDMAVVKGTAYDGGSALGRYTACILEADPSDKRAKSISFCHEAGGKPFILPAGYHRLRLSIDTQGGERGILPISEIDFVQLAAGQTYSVQGQVLSTDRVRFWLADSAGVRQGEVFEAFLPGTGPARFIEDSGLPPAPEKHSLYVTVSLGPKDGAVERDFIKSFADLVYACQADAAILSLPRADEINLEGSGRPTAEAIVARARKANAESLLDIELRQWQTGKRADLDLSQGPINADFKVGVKMQNLSTAANEWSADIKLSVKNDQGGQALAARLVQRFAEIGVFRKCPSSVIQ